ncbi:HlyD family type I secretion periplasmic adaptor subunit [Paraburkholderia adhaesiva]|uniref:HlyD family type I secretion periplasmic adaptor subunit n=1 Tax=Paraburkholderia adhaesiva TaxID=2883244 RepID=UPI001F333E40|nr:HlyD family type I secretion periplasmic adaptor subunit [Paraburkholderia adhaesiva]
MKSLRLQALGDLMRHYAHIWRSVWSMREQLERPPRDADQLAFLPAELELVETPVHPAPRWALRVLVVLSLLVLLIGVAGRLDIVVSASGQFIPNAQVKVIQPAITGVVRDIRVHDGERVNAGQVLVVLDTTQAAADADKARSSRLDAELAAARASALLTAQRENHAPVIPPVEGAAADRMQDAQHQAEGAWLAYRDQYDSAHAELLKRQAELDSTRAEIVKLEQTAPLARQQADAYRALVGDKYVARTDYLDKEQGALDKENELTAQRAHAKELAAGIAEQRSDLEATASKFRHDQLDELEKDTQQATQSRDDETKAHTRQALLSLTAPVAGTVQQLAVHTLGGVVTTAQTLMEVVPDDALEVEARLQNRDVGFVEVGQRVAVKIEAFPYTRYGYLDGTVVEVSNDAVQDKKLGLTFPVRIRLNTNRIRVDNRWITLTPGMAVTADIRTGRRSVIGYFLDPLMQTARESMHER